MKNAKVHRVLYWFNHSKMGFQNSFTTEAIDNADAIQKAKDAVSGVYGSKMLKKFSFSIDVTFTTKNI